MLMILECADMNYEPDLAACVLVPLRVQGSNSGPGGF